MVIAFLPALAAAQVASAPAPSAQPQAQRSEIDSAYYEGELVGFEVSPSQPGERVFTLGPWKFGRRVPVSKPSDRRLNLYLVAPGEQHHAPGFAQYDHNDIINALPQPEKAMEWDVYFAVVLDPELRRDLRAESELLIEAQARWTPGDLLEFSDIPGAFFLSRFLKVHSIPDLQKFRHKDGTLPRLVIVPAGFAVHARARQSQSSAANE